MLKEAAFWTSLKPERVERLSHEQPKNNSNQYEARDLDLSESPGAMGHLGLKSNPGSLVSLPPKGRHTVSQKTNRSEMLQDNSKAVQKGKPYIHIKVQVRAVRLKLLLSLLL